ncbi:MAG TPA: TolC family protein [Candidatus Obscuribacterales bacterium]
MREGNDSLSKTPGCTTPAPRLASGIAMTGSARSGHETAMLCRMGRASDASSPPDRKDICSAPHRKAKLIECKSRPRHRPIKVVLLFLFVLLGIKSQSAPAFAAPPPATTLAPGTTSPPATTLAPGTTSPPATTPVPATTLAPGTTGDGLPQPTADAARDTEPYQPTSKQEVELANPIKLTITKDVPPSDFLTMSGPLGMDEAVAVGIKNNLSLQISEKSWLISKFQARSELGKLGPTITVNPLYATSSLDQMLFFQSDGTVHAPMQPIVRGTSFYTLIAGTQPLFASGRLWSGYKAARAAERQSLANYRADRIATALKVKEAYLEAALNEARTQVGSDYVKFRAWSTANMRARMENGKAPPADYLREAAELAKARAELNNSYRDFNNSLIKLKVVLGVDPVSPILLKDNLEYKETPHDVSVYLAEAIRNRPEIDKANEKIKEMRSKRIVALSQILPQVNLYGLGSNATGATPGVDGTVGGRWGGFVSVIGSWTVFESGVHLNLIRAAGVAVKQAEVEKKDAKLKVHQDVWQSWIDLDLARRNVELTKNEVASAEEDQRLFQKRYEVGKSIALEAFEASVKLFRARLALVEAIYQYRLAQARLTWASGNI